MYNVCVCVCVCVLYNKFVKTLKILLYTSEFYIIRLTKFVCKRNEIFNKLQKDPLLFLRNIVITISCYKKYKTQK